MILGFIQQANKYSCYPDYFTEPFLTIIHEFSGDEITVLMQVCKLWNDIILKRDQAIVMPLTNMINFTVTCLEKKQREVESFFAKALFDPTFKASKNLPHTNHIVAQRTIPKIACEINHIIGALVMECKDLSLLEIEEISTGIEISNYPLRLKNHFHHCMAMRKYEFSKLSFLTSNDRYDETVMSLLNYLLELKGLFFWKINFLKKLQYNCQTKNAFHYVALELAEKGFFNSAFNLAFSKHFIDDISGELRTLLLDNCQSVSQSCILIRKFNNPKVKSEALLDLLSRDQEIVVQSFGSVVEVFNHIALLDESSLVERPHSCGILIALLVKYGEDWQFNHILSLVDSRHTTFYETISLKLVEARLLDKALSVIEMIETNSTNGKRVVAKLLNEISLSFGRIKNYIRAYKIADLIENPISNRRLKNQLRDMEAEDMVAELVKL